MPSTLISCGHIVKCGCKGTNFCVILQIFHGKFVPLHPILRKRLMQDIRNIAIIAHVDHGKTTLVAPTTWNVNEASPFFQRMSVLIGKEQKSISSTPRDTLTLVVRWSACSTWQTVVCSWSMLSKVPCLRRASCCRRRSRLASSPLWWSTRWTSPTAAPRRSTRWCSTSCSR